MFVWSREFKKKFKKLPRKIQDQVLERLVLLTEDEVAPILNSHPLHGQYRAYRSINITGDWRLVYRKLKKNFYLLVTLGTHSQLYE